MQLYILFFFRPLHFQLVTGRYKMFSLILYPVNPPSARRQVSVLKATISELKDFRILTNLKAHNPTVEPTALLRNRHE